MEKHFSRIQRIFILSILIGLCILQGTLFWFLKSTESIICNSGGPWPFSLTFSFLGNGLFILFLTVVVFIWAWKTLKNNKPVETGKTELIEALAWALLVAAGLSHSVERISASCVLDYWQLHVATVTIHFNLGDVFLTIGAFALIFLWLRSSKK